MFKYLFDMGAIAVVHVPNGIVVSRGGKATLSLKGSGSYNRYQFIRSTQKGQYYYAVLPDTIDTDGWYGSERTNYWNVTNLDNRGFTSSEVGLAVDTTEGKGNDHIQINGYPGAPRLINSGAAFLGSGNSAPVSDTLSMVLSFWVRKPDRSGISAADCYVHMSDSAVWTDPNIAGTTQFERWEHGWHRVWAVVPPCSSVANRVQGLKVAAGTTLYYDLPQHERFSTSTPGPTEPIHCPDSTDRARAQFVLECFLRGASGHGQHLSAGAIAIACSPERKADEHTFGQLLLYGDTDTNHGISLSDSDNSMAGWTRIATVTEAFLEGSEIGVFPRHTPIGACHQWGTAGPGTGDFFFGIQGIKGGSLQTGVPNLPALATARLLIGGRLTAGDVASSGANSRILFAAIFRKKPGPQACMKISHWMQQKARAYWRWQ